MSKLILNDYNFILNMLDSISWIQQYTADFNTPDDFFKDIKTFDATLMNFIAIGEMVDKLSEELKETTQGIIDWPKIKGFRNILAHNYFGIDAEEVWQIIENNIPELQIKLSQLVE